MSSGVSARHWVEEDGAHIDVRGLPPPEPIIAILTRIETLAGDVALIVHHEREPMMLYPELAERGWLATRIDAPEGEVRLRIERVR
jgi:hypothetical protein